MTYRDPRDATIAKLEAKNRELAAENKTLKMKVEGLTNMRARLGAYARDAMKPGRKGDSYEFTLPPLPRRKNPAKFWAILAAFFATVGCVVQLVAHGLVEKGPSEVEAITNWCAQACGDLPSMTAWDDEHGSRFQSCQCGDVE